ncbi:DUF4846 domain-containing protein [Sphingobacterium sp. PCS056]|jgi:hypothetical protein|uniref:DUF4846 domain-containing protein n=1 Tax=Sphingobacterium sp. PCS056 TaxID=2931400 RepID=UPI00200CBBEE|nr:DUF4846 domain-containing protein [Sphingobacterium sp. PCS056]UPZ36016.1 DUF4846 domain-containing protein [Sphingobacterium sp. PCS056]
MKILCIISIGFILINCTASSNQNKLEDKSEQLHMVDGYNQQLVDAEGKIIKDRFKPPVGYERINYKKNEFGYFLEQLPVKPIDKLVTYYNGRTKDRRDIYASVVDLPIGKRDLHQCADAVMRLRADYLYQNKKYNDIHFNFVSDGKPRYYNKFADGDYSYSTYWKYLEYIFAYANTASLHDELSTVKSMDDVRIGDTFVQKGNPIGHAIVVVDMVVNPKTGQKLVLMAQSYMPAQELQIINNPINKSISPWYALSDEVIRTPEWKFYSENLKTWN